MITFNRVISRVGKIVLEAWQHAPLLISCMASCRWNFIDFILLYMISNELNYIILLMVARLLKKQLLSVSVQIWNGIVLSFLSLALLSYFIDNCLLCFTVDIFINVIINFCHEYYSIKVSVVIKFGIIIVIFIIIIVIIIIIIVIFILLFFELIQMHLERSDWPPPWMYEQSYRSESNLSDHIVSYQMVLTMAARTYLSRSLLILHITVILLYAFYIVSCILSNKHFRVRIRVRVRVYVAKRCVAHLLICNIKCYIHVCWEAGFFVKVILNQ